MSYPPPPRPTRHLSRTSMLPIGRADELDSELALDNSQKASSSISSSRRKLPPSSSPTMARPRRSTEKLHIEEVPASSHSLPKSRSRTTESFQNQASSSNAPRRRTVSSNSQTEGQRSIPNPVHTSTSQIPSSSSRRPSTTSSPSSYTSRTITTPSSSRRPSTASTTPSSVNAPVSSRNPSVADTSIPEHDVSHSRPPRPSSPGRVRTNSSSAGHTPSRISRKAPPAIAVLHTSYGAATSAPSPGMTPTQSTMKAPYFPAPSGSRTQSMLSTPPKPDNRQHSPHRASVATISPTHSATQQASPSANQLRLPASPLPILDMKQLLSRPASIVSGSASEDGRNRKSVLLTGSDNEGGRIAKHPAGVSSDTDEGGGGGYRSAPSRVTGRKSGDALSLSSVSETPEQMRIIMAAQRNRLYMSWEKERDRVDKMTSPVPSLTEKPSRNVLKRKPSNSKKPEDAGSRRLGTPTRSPLPSPAIRPGSSSKDSGDTLTPAGRVAMAYKEREKRRSQALEEDPRVGSSQSPHGSYDSEKSSRMREGGLRSSLQTNATKRNSPSHNSNPRKKSNDDPFAVDGTADDANGRAYYTVVGSKSRRTSADTPKDGKHETFTKIVSPRPHLHKASSSAFESPVRSWVSTGKGSPASSSSHARALSRKLSVPKLSGSSKDKERAPEPASPVNNDERQGRRSLQERRGQGGQWCTGLSVDVSPPRASSYQNKPTTPLSTAKTSKTESPSGGGLWKLIKRISSGGLRDKYYHQEEAVPPVPKIPQDLNVYAGSPQSQNKVKLSSTSLSSGTPADLSDSAGSVSTNERGIFTRKSTSDLGRGRGLGDLTGGGSPRLNQVQMGRMSPIIPEFSTDAAINTFTPSRKSSSTQDHTHSPLSLPTKPPVPDKNPRRKPSSSQGSDGPRASDGSSKREARKTMQVLPEVSLSRPSTDTARGRRSLSRDPSTRRKVKSPAPQFRKIDSEAEKAAMWEELMERSARAGGTLHLNTADVLPSDDMSSMMTRSSVAESDVTIMG